MRYTRPELASDSTSETSPNSTELQNTIDQINKIPLIEDAKEGQKALNREYILSKICDYILGQSTLALSVDDNKITINNHTIELPQNLSITSNELQSAMNDYFEDDFFEKQHGANIYDYFSKKINTDFNNNHSEIASYLKNPGNIESSFKETFPKKNYGIITDYLGQNYFSNLSIKLLAKQYKETQDSAYLEQIGFVESMTTQYLGDETAENYKAAHPLLKTAVVGGGSLYALFKLISYIHSKVKEPDGLGWFKTIFGGMAVELIGQVVTGKSLTSGAIKEVSKLFKGSDNKSEMETIFKQLEDNNKSNPTGGYRALAMIFIGGEDITKQGAVENLILTPLPGKEALIDFFAQQAGIDKTELLKRVKEGHTKIVSDIITPFSTIINEDHINTMTGTGIRHSFGSRVNTAHLRSKKILETINSNNFTIEEVKDVESNSNALIQYFTTGDELALKAITAIS